MGSVPAAPSAASTTHVAPGGMSPGGMSPGPCSSCGAPADGDARSTWGFARHGAAVSWTCPACLRRQLRDIETHTAR